MVRRYFLLGVVLTALALAVVAPLWPPVLWSGLVLGPLVLLGGYDIAQRKRTILRNFPLIGHARYLLEALRPEIQQYFIESNIDAFPIEREFRSLVYQRAKGELETVAYGTQRDAYRIGYEWAGHSIAPLTPLEEPPRIAMGGPGCKSPYSASLLNVAAMSFGSLSAAAVRALSGGAQLGDFALNTGEGGVAPHHLEPGSDLIWQIGSGYFGCRDAAGRFDPAAFQERAALPNVRMIEVKLSQGAKPGHGGILPGIKVTREIAAIRGVQVGQTVFSPPAHSAFATPRELLEFLAALRELSGGKPVGVKLCVGRQSEFLGICKAMLATGITPDFVAVDGGEGGSGAAPLEFSNSLGMPARDGWVFVHNALRGVGLRDRIRVIASGKITTGFHIIRALAIGADLCYSARGMMLALGCIQALRCNTDHCPTGVATQNAALVRGLHIGDKTLRVARYQRATVASCLELLSAMGLSHPDQLRPHHIFRRVDDLRVRHLGELHEHLENGQLCAETGIPARWREAWGAAHPDRWAPARAVPPASIAGA